MAEEDDLYVGKRSLEEGLLGKEHLLESLLDLAEERRRRDGQKTPRPLGALLVARGFLKQADLNRLLAGRLGPGSVSADLEFGKVLIACKYATAGQVDEAVREQEADRESGRPPRRLGEILLSKGHLSAENLQRALAYRERAIYACTGCAARYNILHAKPDGRYACRKCGRPLAPATDLGARADASMYATRSIPKADPPAPAPPPSPDQPEIDRALALYLRQKNMLRRETLRELIQFQDELVRYGLSVPLGEVLSRRKIVTWAQSETLRKTDFASIVKSPAWQAQSVPGYRITGKIASGGFATIFAAEPVFGSTRVALKLMLAERAKNPSAVESFRREARLLMRFDHPHIVKAFDQDEFRGIPYLTMELVEGRSLDALVRDSGPLPPAAALRAVRQAAEALSYMQREGYIHRDLKPENILLDRDHDAKVCDLGFALPLRERAVGAAALTQGTVGYISPEQARGELDLKVGTDIYSLGLTLYFALTACPPFEGMSSETIMADRFATGVAAPDFGRLRAPEPLVEVVRKMLHPERAGRFTTYPELLAAFDRVGPAVVHK